MRRFDLPSNRAERMLSVLNVQRIAGSRLD